MITWHVLAVVLVSFPAPLRQTNKDHWKKPTVQAELADWSRRLGWIGIERTPDQIQALSEAVVERWVAERARALSPFEFYLRKVNARQAWYMFTGPDREPQRFTVWYNTKKDREPVRVFEMGRSFDDPTLVDPDFVLSYRVRRAILFSSWGRTKDTFQLLCRYFTKDLREKKPDVKDVTCELLQQKVEHPARRDVARPTKVLRRVVIRPNGTERLSGEGSPTPIDPERDKRKMPERPRPPVRRGGAPPLPPADDARDPAQRPATDREVTP